MIRSRVWLVGLFALLAGCGRGEGWLDHQGNTHTREDLEGRWAVVNYWAEWCAPCREELPELNELAQGRPDVKVIGINFDGLEGETLRRLSDDMGIAFPVLGQDFAEAFALPRPPVLQTTYLIDAEGRLAMTLQGPQSKSQLIAALEQEPSNE